MISTKGLSDADHRRWANDWNRQLEVYSCGYISIAGLTRQLERVNDGIRKQLKELKDKEDN